MPELNNPLVCNLKGLKIAYLNVNRLLNKMEDIIIILNKYSLHILFIAETWLNENVSDYFLQISDYSFVRVDRQYNSGGGLICYVLNNINISILATKTTENIEYINILLNFSNHSKPLLISALYRKPSADDRFFVDFNDMFKSLSSFTKILCLGDFNICALKKKSLLYKKLKHCCLLVNMKNLITSTTHKKSCIDLLFSNSEFIPQISIYGTIDIPFSDHKLIYLCIKKSFNKRKSNHVNNLICKFDNNMLPNFQLNLFNQLNLINFHSLDNADIMLDRFVNTFSFVSKQIYVIAPKLPCKTFVSWINPKYLYLAYQRNKYYKKYLKSKDISIFLCFKHYRNKANNLAKKLKSISISKKLDTKSPKQFWNNVKQLLPLKCHLFNTDSINNNKEKIPTDDEFGNYFANIVNDILSSNSMSKMNVLSNDSFLNSKSTFSFNLINPEQITKLINKLPLSYFPDTLGISVFLLKAANSLVSHFISLIFNKFILSHSFPSIFKTATIIPLHKVGSTSNVSNYRPISILPHLSKLFEYVLHEQISNFVENHQIMSNYQFGFRRFYNTNFAISHFINDILIYLNKNSNVIALFLDLKKAFDIVDHSLLIKKLQKYSFELGAQMLLKDYLTDRFMIVGNSKPFPLKYGVPQGSVLGPLLFSLFINDIFLVTNMIHLICFADDTVCYFEISSPDQIILFSNEIDKIFNWFSNNNLFLNNSKCKLMNFHLKKNLLKGIEYLKIGNHTFSFTNEYKYLGIIIDNHLKFFSQYKKLFSIHGHYISVFKFLTKFVTKNHLKRIYTAFILPIIEYCMSSYIHFSVTKFKKLVKLNNYLLSFTSVDKFEFSLNIRLFLSITKIVQKIFQGTAPKYLSSYLIDESLKKTRLGIILPGVNKTIFKHSFQFYFPNYISRTNFSDIYNNEVSSSSRSKQLLNLKSKYIFNIFDIFD
jgi:hypothetical protein